jgi:hypothetical protein
VRALVVVRYEGDPTWCLGGVHPTIHEAVGDGALRIGVRFWTAFLRDGCMPVDITDVESFAVEVEESGKYTVANVQPGRSPLHYEVEWLGREFLCPVQGVN